MNQEKIQNPVKPILIQEELFHPVLNQSKKFPNIANWGHVDILKSNVPRSVNISKIVDQPHVNIAVEYHVWNWENSVIVVYIF